MPVVRLSRFEVRRNLLPPVCVVCGAPAVVHRDKTFSWFPGWVWVILSLSCVVGAALLAGLILMFVLKKSMRVRVPACAEHEGHWRRRTAFVATGWFLTLTACAALFVFLGVQPEQRQKELIVPVCGSAAITFAAWLVTLVVVANRGVRAVEITDRSITLADVHERFDWALEADRERDRAEAEADERELLAFLRERRERRRAADAAVPPAEPVYDDLERQAGDLIGRDDPPPDRPPS